MSQTPAIIILQIRSQLDIPPSWPDEEVVVMVRKLVDAKKTCEETLGGILSALEPELNNYPEGTPLQEVVADLVEQKKTQVS